MMRSNLTGTLNSPVQLRTSSIAGAVSNVIRRLDDAGVAVHDLQLREPSLDDVFAEATGYRLEGAEAAAPAGDASATGKRRRRRGRS